jgi:RNase P subunit RPR2
MSWSSYEERLARKKVRTPEQERALRRKYMYGIEDGRKSGTCELCGEFTENIHCDHDHKTGKFRGWLCATCNTTIRFKMSDQKV